MQEVKWVLNIPIMGERQSLHKYCPFGSWMPPHTLQIFESRQYLAVRAIQVCHLIWGQLKSKTYENCRKIIKFQIDYSVVCFSQKFLVVQRELDIMAQHWHWKHVSTTFEISKYDRAQKIFQYLCLCMCLRYTCVYFTDTNFKLLQITYVNKMIL